MTFLLLPPSISHAWGAEPVNYDAQCLLIWMLGELSLEGLLLTFNRMFQLSNPVDHRSESNVIEPERANYGLSLSISKILFQDSRNSQISHMGVERRQAWIGSPVLSQLGPNSLLSLADEMLVPSLPIMIFEIGRESSFLILCPFVNLRQLAQPALGYPRIVGLRDPFMIFVVCVERIVSAAADAMHGPPFFNASPII